MRSRATQKDIAQRLNLSQSLVASVLNGRPGVWVSQQNRDRILATARELDYRPHAAARALRGGKTHVAACVLFGAAGHDAVVERLADSIALSGYDLLVKVVTDPRLSGARLDNLFSNGLCDAVVLWGLEDQVEEPAARLASAGVPFVVKGRFEETHPDWPQADFDHEAMMREAVQHLAQRGHRRIAYMGYDNALVYAACLRRGFCKAVEETCDARTDARLIAAIGGSSLDAAAALERWSSLSDAERPTAVVMGTGRAPWQEIELWLARRDRRVGEGPGDFGIAGLGGDHTPLLFGAAHAYFRTDLADLAGALSHTLLLPMLAGNDVEPRVLRVKPPLRACPTLALPLPGGSAQSIL